VPKNEPVSKSDSWLLFIPIWPIWVWAFWRIQSLRRGIPVILGVAALNVVVTSFLPFPWGLGFALFGNAWIIVLIHRRWAKDWNRKFRVEN